MLSYISVKNFAIIENIEVDFKSGMTSLTGETGAGKSLLIDAIGLLLGDRANTTVVRTGESKAVVQGIFKISNPKIFNILEDFDIDSSSDELIIKREISSSNNNTIKVNNTVVTLSMLKEITRHLSDIHTQHDTHRLINPLTYLDIVDGFDEDLVNKAKETYLNKLSIYKQELKEYNRLLKNNDSLNERLDLIKFQLNEIESHNLIEDEKDEIETELEKLRNFDKIFQALNEAALLIDSTDSLGNIYNSIRRIEDVNDYSDSFKSLTTNMYEGYYALEDSVETLKKEINSLDFSPYKLEELETRLNTLESLERKYKKSIKDIILYYEEIKYDIQNIENYDEILDKQKKSVKSTYNDCLQEANNLSKIRREIASFIENELVIILKDLELKNTEFKITFLENTETDYLHNHFMENGIDTIDFMLSTNIGEPVKPLSKAASGGEMSRIMLGLKALLIKSQKLSLIIFDEIDTGVSGFVASQVAKKMLDISKLSQVICITHIPQVAAISNHHLRVSKTIENNRTIAHINELIKDERIVEIAGMISGEKVTESSLKSAEELINS